jgi:acetaldehyde dehydrogenase (acetylating)
MIASQPRRRVAILGSGNIATDLLSKVLRSRHLECSLFTGRNVDSPGINRARNLGVRTSALGIESIAREPDVCDIVFDATSAKDHPGHWSILQRLGKMVIDLTPSRKGHVCVPAVNLGQCLRHQNISTITCGGQASIPLIHAINEVHADVNYIEVVSTIASRSAGPATRLNIDEYVEATEAAIRAFSRAKAAKAILILNPVEPCIEMQTTVFAMVDKPNIPELTRRVEDVVARVRTYVPGYELVLPPTFEGGRITTIVNVRGRGDYLPTYAGNLDIINCAAIACAEEYAAHSRLAPDSWMIEESRRG